MKKILFAAIFASALATGAQANDFNWAGWYAGGDLGQSEVSGNWKNTQAFDPSGAPIASTSADSENMKGNGTVGALVGGYNWIVAPMWVAGAEAKLVFSNQSTQINNIPGLDPTPDTNPGDGMFSTAKVTAGNGVVLRAKAGYLLKPETMLYGTAGVTYQNFKVEALCPKDTYVCNPGLPAQSSSSSHNYVGWTLGAGLEHAFTDRWIGRIDGAYTRFPSHDFVALQWVPGASYGSNATLSPESYTLAIGVNYKF